MSRRNHRRAVRRALRRFRRQSAATLRVAEQMRTADPWVGTRWAFSALGSEIRRFNQTLKWSRKGLL